MNNLKACNVGLNIIPFNGSSYNGQPIHIVTWSGDRECGIFQNQFNFTGKQCIGNNQFGNVIEYSQSDINCDRPIENTPLDSIIFMSLSALVLVLGATKLLRTV